MLSAGYVGCTIASVTFVNSFCVSISADSGIMDKETVKELIHFIEQNLEQELDRTKDMPVINKESIESVKADL